MKWACFSGSPVNLLSSHQYQALSIVLLRFILNMLVHIWGNDSHILELLKQWVLYVYLGHDSKLTILLYLEQMWVIPVLELSVLYLPLLYRFTEELWTRSAGEGGSHWRHDCAALPATGGGPCCRGERHQGQACSQEGRQSPACSSCGVKACVWHPCPLDPNDKGGEETVKAISWKRKLPLVYFLVDTKLLLGSLGRIRSVFLLWWPQIM